MVLDVKNLVIRNPNWAIENSVQVPFDSVKNDYFFYVADFTVLFRFVFFLEKIFNAKPAGSRASRAALKRFKRCPREKKMSVLLRPQWLISNQLSLPMVSVKEDKSTVLRGIYQIAIPITIFLDTLFYEKDPSNGRSVDEDQFQIFKSLEGVMQATGMDGKSCLLRTICEFQTNPIGKYSMIGEILTIVLTPRRGLNDFLHEYIEAELVGQSHNQTCSSVYKGCPVSVFNLLKQYSSPSDKPVVQDEVIVDENHGLHAAHHNGHDHDVHRNELTKETPFSSHHDHEDNDF